MSLPTTYRANGKLLLTGEYLVLHGAKALALPLNVGQRLLVSNDSASKNILWQAYYHHQLWFWCELNPASFSVLSTTDAEKANTLVRIFTAIKILIPGFFIPEGTSFKTTLESNPDWGFGSSSTLVSLLSNYAGVDPFLLNEMVFQGSGFDIACASANGPVFYTRNQPAVSVSLDFPFADRLFLIYSGRKKATAKAVRSFLSEKVVTEQQIAVMSSLSEEIARCSDQTEFNRLIDVHEAIISKLIGHRPVKRKLFPDFDGAVKSLGAWGGDFFLASANEWTFAKVMKYFENKGLTTVFKWDDLILKRQ